MAENRLTTEVTLHIFNPYETFTPKPVGAELVELSLRSVRLHTLHLTESECEMLMEERTLAKIEISAPFLAQTVTLKADVFWANYIVRGMDEPPYADLGFNLRPLDPPQQRDVLRIMEYQRAAADRP